MVGTLRVKRDTEMPRVIQAEKEHSLLAHVSI